MRILGVAGRKRSGKDTLAALMSEFGYQRVALADKVREYLYILNPIIFELDGKRMYLRDLVDAFGWDFVKDRYPEARRLMQFMGTELGRNTWGEDYWTQKAEGVITERGLERVVITDIRFQDEISWVHGHKGIVVRIDRPATVVEDSHVSETGVDSLTDIDIIIDNSGDLAGLETQARHLNKMLNNYWNGKGI